MEMKISNLNKVFNNRELFYIDNLELKSDNIYAVVGENGCGKSTLLRIISSFDSDYEGEVLFYKNKILINNVQDIITYVHQNPYMFNFSVYKNIEMAKNLSDRLNPVWDSDDLIKRFGVSHILERNARLISGGEAQKVSFIRSLNQGSEIILLDEPTSSMDAASCKILEEVLLEIKKNRIIIIVTHNIFQALRVCDYIINFSDGMVSIMDKQGALKTEKINELINFIGSINI